VSFAVKVVFAGKIEIYATLCHGTNWQRKYLVCAENLNINIRALRRNLSNKPYY